MELFVGTAVGVISVVIAYLTYRAQLGQSFKRIHYTSFLTPFVIPRAEETRQSLVVRHAGTDLTYPVLCGVRIENTGRSPILPSDFDSPIIIHYKGIALFRCGQLTWNRPSVIDIGSHPESFKVDVPKNEIYIGPVLLNPRDSVTLIYVVDAALEEWKLRVTGRIAGIEEIVELPRLRPGSATFTVTGKSLPMTINQTAGTRENALLSVWALVIPILADPENMFSKEMDVVVKGTIVRSAHLLSIIISNGGTAPVEHVSKRSITFKLSDSRFARLLSARTEEDSLDRLTPLTGNELHCYINTHRTIAVIKPPRLAPNESLRVNYITTGGCDNLSVESVGIKSDDAQIMHMQADDIIEKNFAEAEPRLLLTNQRAYMFWHSLVKEYPWLQRIFPSKNDRSQQSED